MNDPEAREVGSEEPIPLETKTRTQYLCPVVKFDLVQDDPKIKSSLIQLLCSDLYSMVNQVLVSLS